MASSAAHHHHHHHPASSPPSASSSSLSSANAAQPSSRRPLPAVATGSGITQLSPVRRAGAGPPPRPPQAQAQQQQQFRGKDENFWSHLKIEIDPPYEGQPPEWHKDESEMTSIPAQISDSPSEAGTGVSHIGGESFAVVVPDRQEPRVAKHLTTAVSSALLAVGLGHVALEVAMFLLLRVTTSWWAGVFSIAAGALGLSGGRWECLRIYHRACCIMGVLLNAIAACLDTHVDNLLREPGVTCGGPADAFGGATLGDWCALGGRRREEATCACVVPGGQPGEKDSCLAFRDMGGGSGQCDAAADALYRMVAASAALCWTLAATCLAASLARLAVTCYKRRKCPEAPTALAAWWARRRLQQQRRQSSTDDDGQQVPPYLRNSIDVTPAVGAGSSPPKEGEGGEEEEQEKPTKGRKVKSSNILANPYYLRDCPESAFSSEMGEAFDSDGDGAGRGLAPEAGAAGRGGQLPQREPAAMSRAV